MIRNETKEIRTMQTEDGIIKYVVPLHTKEEHDKIKHDFYEFLLKLVLDNKLKKSKTAE